jgi:hypothetical protein
MDNKKEEEDEESIFFKNFDYDFNKGTNNIINYDEILPFRIYDEEPIFAEINYNTNENSNNIEMHVDSNNILNKINKFEDTYFNNIKSTENEDNIKKIFEQNLILINKTLPGFIISLMHKTNNQPIDERDIYINVFQNYSELRKPNGTPYKGDIYKVLKSTLVSTLIFEKNNEGKWSYHEKKAFDYVMKLTEKTFSKKV